MSDASTPIFGIGAVAKLVELPPATIRTWEARYGIVVPARGPGGQRVYTRAHVDQLRFLTDAIAAGSRPGEAHRLLAERLGEDGAGGALPSVRVVVRDPGALADVLLRQLLERAGFAIADDAQVAVVSVGDARSAELSGRLKRDGRRVLALVEPGVAEPEADTVLRLPIAPRELVEAVRRLAGS